MTVSQEKQDKALELLKIIFQAKVIERKPKEPGVRRESSPEIEKIKAILGVK